MNSQPQFDTLSAALDQQRLNGGFERYQVVLGPLRLSVLVAPEAHDLGLEIAFCRTQLSLDSAETMPADGFRVYVLDLSMPISRSLLEPFVDRPLHALQDLSGRGSADQFSVFDRVHGILKIFDQINRVGVFAFADATRVPTWELFSPLKDFVHLHALTRSCLLLHAASLVWPDRQFQTALLVGPGGSGKSTLTAYALAQGLLTQGDDYVLVDLREDPPRCWSVYRTIKLHSSSPASETTRGLAYWQTDSLTGKSVMLATSLDEGGVLAEVSVVGCIHGLSLVRSSEIHNPKADTIVSDPHRHPYLHTCMSTVQQIPYRMDTTLALAKRLHEWIPYRAHTMGPGQAGLAAALDAMGCTDDA